ALNTPPPDAHAPPNLGPPPPLGRAPAGSREHAAWSRSAPTLHRERLREDTRLSYAVLWRKVMQVRQFRPGQRPRDVDLADCTGLDQNDTSLVWVEMAAPSASEFDEVVALFNLDPLAVQMLQRSNPRSTVRAYETHYV